MGRSFFQSLFKRRSSASCPLLPEAATFFSSLCEQLKKLESSLAESSVSLHWSIEAATMLKTMQLDLLALLKQFPFSGVDEDWFNHYMDATMALLDFCNSMKSATSATNRYCLAVGLAIESLRSTDSYSCMHSLNLIEIERNTAPSVRCARPSCPITSKARSCSDKSLAIIVLAASTATMVVSLLLVSAIAAPIAVEAGIGECARKFPELKPFAEALAALVGRFREKIAGPDTGSCRVLVEHEMVDRMLGELKAQLVEGLVEDKESFEGGVELLRTRSSELGEGVEVFGALVDELFDVVIRGRKEMLGILKDWGG